MEPLLSNKKMLIKKNNEKQTTMSVVINMSSIAQDNSNFRLLINDTLVHILSFVGKKSFCSFGLITKRCYDIFVTFNIPKKTFLCGYASLSKISDRYERDPYRYKTGVANGIVLFYREDVLRWAISSNDIGLIKEICNVAAGTGRLKVLDNIFSKSDDGILVSLRNNWYLCAHAASKGQLESVKWLRNNGCAWNNAYAITKAAEGGHLSTLKYLHVNGCEWNYMACTLAVSRGHLETLKYLRENGCEFHEEECLDTAAGFGQLRILKYLFESGSKFHSSICYEAAEGEHLHILKFLRDNGYEWDSYEEYLDTDL